MALTRKLLKGMGLTDEQVDTIIEAHTDTVDGLKDSMKEYKADAEKLASVQKQLTAAETELEAARKDSWKDRHDALKKEFEGYKADVTAKEARAAKEKAVRAYYESKNIVGKSLEVAMRGSRAEIDALELEDGKIKNSSALDALVSGDFAGLVGSTSTRGAETASPPASTGGAVRRSKEEILAMKDTAERQKAIYENRSLFGI